LSFENQERYNIFSGIDIGLPDSIYIGDGLTFFFKGWIYNPLCRVKKVEIEIDGLRYPMQEINLPRPDIYNHLFHFKTHDKNRRSAHSSGFSGSIDLTKKLEGTKKTIRFFATFENGHAYLFHEKNTLFLKKDDYYLSIDMGRQDNSEGPLIAICLATYFPKIRWFKTQIDSIRKQTYTNWVCIISDDFSDRETVHAINKLVKDDDRFHFFKHSENLGFYKNFERALRYLPAEASFVSFSDQDDYWYPNKIERLIGKISEEQNTSLVFSDMKIIDDKGHTLSDTFWTNRKNHYNDLSMILVCGTVTGAAMIFRRELLDIALPFPQNIGDSFHDHFISCTALTVGSIAYIDEPLYDYRQHKGNVRGNIEFDSDSLNMVKTASKEFTGLSGLHKLFMSFYDNFENKYVRLFVISKTLSMRTDSQIRHLKIFDNTLFSIIKLIQLHLRIKLKRRTTENAEILSALSYLARKCYKYVLRIGVG